MQPGEYICILGYPLTPELKDKKIFFVNEGCLVQILGRVQKIEVL